MQPELGDIVAGITSGQTKLSSTQRQMDASPIRVPSRRSNIVQKSLDRGSDNKNAGGKKKNRTIYQLPQVPSI